MFELTTENTEPDLKVHALLVRGRLSFQKHLYDTYSLSARIHTTTNQISIRFLLQYQRHRKCFSSERELKKTLPDTLMRPASYGL